MTARRGPARWWAADVVARRLVNVDRTVAATLDEPSAATTRTMLVVGSDARTALTGAYRRLRADILGRRADVIVLAVSRQPPARSHVLHLPRDLWVELAGVGDQKLGWALDYGGPSLLIATVRELVGVPIHHCVVGDFQAFGDVIDALGGVELVLPGAVRDATTGLDLPAGRSRLSGFQALALVRSRHDDASGARSDEARVERQRELLAALRRGPVGRPTVRRIGHLVRALRHVSVDERLHGEAVAAMAHRLRAGPVDVSTLPVTRVEPFPSAFSPFPPRRRTRSSWLARREPDASEILALVRDTAGCADAGSLAR